MEILQYCPTSVTDIDLSSTGPLGLGVFSLQSRREWWSNISAMYFELRYTRKEWLDLKVMLPYFSKLKSLYLEFRVWAGNPCSQDVADSASIEDDLAVLQPLDSLLLELSMEVFPGDLGLVKKIVSSWPRIGRLSIKLDISSALLKTIFDQLFGAQVLLRDSVSASQRLEEVQLTFMKMDDEDSDDSDNEELANTFAAIKDQTEEFGYR